MNTKEISRTAQCCAGVALLAAVSAGCRARSSMTDRPPIPDLSPQPAVVPPLSTEQRARSRSETVPITASLQTDRTRAVRGQTVTFTIKLRNSGKKMESLQFITGQVFDLVIKSQPPREVWRWSSNKVFTQAVHDVRLRGGEEQLWTATWDQTGSDGRVLPRGRYLVEGRIMTRGGIVIPSILIELSD